MREKTPLPTEDEPRPERCETCRWWDSVKGHSKFGNVHPCRVRPPVVEYVTVEIAGSKFSVPLSGWPWTFPGDWCGEWKAKITQPSAKTSAVDFEAMAMEVEHRMEIRKLGLETRTLNVLEIGGIEKISDLESRTADELLLLRGFGPYCLADVRAKLAARGLKLKGDRSHDLPDE